MSAATAASTITYFLCVTADLGVRVRRHPSNDSGGAGIRNLSLSRFTTNPNPSIRPLTEPRFRAHSATV
jgi:hypothetical protein